MKGISKVEVSVVEQVTNGDVLLCNTAFGKLGQKLAKMLPLGIWQYFTPGAFTQHREENVRLLKEINNKNESIICITL